MAKSRVAGLVGLGVLPLVLGFFYNWMLTTLPVRGILYLLLPVLLLVGWGYLSYRVASSSSNPFLQALLTCSFGLVILVLVLYQELAMGQYWGNLVGIATQFFFLPWISLASSVMSLISPFVHSIRVWPLYVIIWIGLLAVSCFGCVKKRKMA